MPHHGLDRPARPRPPGRTARAERPIGPAFSTAPSCGGCWNAATSCVNDLEQAETRLRFLPGELHRAEGQRREAEGAIADLEQRRQEAESVIAEFDRPLRRRRHEHELHAARRELEGIPDRLDEAEGSLSAAEHTVAALHADATRNRDYLAGRSDIDAEVADIDDQLDQDLRIRTRVTRREQPVRVVTLLGSRPIHGQEARRWDRAAGDLAQHQAAFDVLDGVGPQPQYQHRSAYADSHARVTELLPPSERPSFDLSVEPPDLGLSL